MDELFISTIEFNTNDFVGITTVNDLILKKVREQFTNKCLNGKRIKEITHLNRRGIIEYGRNKFPATLRCDVQFAAICKSYNKGDLILLRITKIEQNRVVAETDDYIAFMEMNKQMPISSILKVGSYFIAIIAELLLETGKKISMMIRPYIKRPKFQITRVANALENEKIREAITLCINNIKKITANDKIKEAFEIFHVKSPIKWIYEPLSIYDPVKINNELDNIMFVINPYDAIENGLYYILPDGDTLKSYESIVKTEAVSLEYKVYKYCSSVCNYIEVIEQISKLTDEQYKQNEAIWKFYR